MPFGAHMSISGGVAKAFARGEHATCETIQIFSKNQRNWQGKRYSDEEIADYKAEQQRSGIHPVVVHDSYLINMASPKDDLWERSMAAFRDELERCDRLDIPYVVMHPGAHTGSGEAAGLQRQAEALNRIFERDEHQGVTVLLETTAGQGSVLGWHFDHLARLLELVTHDERLGICVDTCHMFVAGYDIRTPETYAETFTALDQAVGLERIKVFHLNDTVNDLGSRVDRHTHIGQGCIGTEAFRLLVNDSRFADIPMIIETPKGDDMAEDRENLALLRSLRAPADGAA
jgi:deoxyribonuclease-4